MQKITGSFFTCIIWFMPTLSPAQNNAVSVWEASMNKMPSEDWLVKPVHAPAQIFRSADNKDIVLYNGLVKRVFRLSPNLVCIDYTNMINGRQMLRAVTAEARLTINNKKFNVGGLYGQKERAYLLPEWLDKFKANDSDFHYVSYTVTDIPPYLHWQTKAWASNKQQPKGKMISFLY
ncbi:MAG: alpha-galactosidase, partial [Sediminibacterium sp.]|nr:alpha-galactosidase [Sediminibacterium sp.]